jgi:hypothetical protein
MANELDYGLKFTLYFVERILALAAIVPVSINLFLFRDSFEFTNGLNVPFFCTILSLPYCCLQTPAERGTPDQETLPPTMWN